MKQKLTALFDYY